MIGSIKALWLWIGDWWRALNPSECDIQALFAAHAPPTPACIEQIRAAVRRLPPEVQCVLIERSHGATYQQIAAKYGVDEATARDVVIAAYPLLQAELDAASQPPES